MGLMDHAVHRVIRARTDTQENPEIQGRKVHAERKASQVSADKQESQGEKALTVILVLPDPQASLGCVVPWEIVERKVLSAHVAPTDAQVTRVLRERTEIQEEKALADLVVYRDVAVQPVLWGNPVMLDLRASEAHQVRKVTVDLWVHRVKPDHQDLLDARVLQVPRVPMETTAHQASQESTVLVA